jgi:hypothetical protein
MYRRYCGAVVYAWFSIGEEQAPVRLVKGKLALVRTLDLPTWPIIQPGIHLGEISLVRVEISTGGNSTRGNWNIFVLFWALFGCAAALVPR